jgi:glucokinase
MRQLTGLPTVLAGDGQCFALGEHWLGSGRGSSALLGIVVSTGIGGGLVIDGVPLLGPTGNAGHVGHMSIDPYGERCSCGGRGCVERYASGPNLVRWALANGWQPGLATVPVTVEATIDTAGLVVSGGDTVTSTLASHAGSGGPSGIALPAIDGHPRSGGIALPATDGHPRPDGIALSAMDGRTGTPLPAMEGRTGADGTALPAMDGRTKFDGDGLAGSDGDGRTGVETERANARVLARDAAAGDAVALAAFERAGRALAGMIVSTAAAAELTMVVIGGGVSGAGPVLFEPLERALDDVAGLPFVRAVQVQPTMLGIRAGLAGAAKLAWDYSRSAN